LLALAKRFGTHSRIPTIDDTGTLKYSHSIPALAAAVEILTGTRAEYASMIRFYWKLGM